MGNWAIHKAPPCANCGREDCGRMLANWGHGFMCCSDACGKRLAHKLQNGMGHPHEDAYESSMNGYPFGDPDPRFLDLRIRIKQLAHRIKDQP